MKLSYIEAIFVAAVLSSIAYLTGGKYTDYLSALASLMSFLVFQLSFDLADGSEAKNTGKRIYLLFIMKEIVWFSTFLLLRCWPLLAGSVVFLSYPYVRRRLRK